MAGNKGNCQTDREQQPGGKKRPRAARCFDCDKITECHNPEGTAACCDHGGTDWRRLAKPATSKDRAKCAKCGKRSRRAKTQGNCLECAKSVDGDDSQAMSGTSNQSMDAGMDAGSAQAMSGTSSSITAEAQVAQPRKTAKLKH